MSRTFVLGKQEIPIVVEECAWEGVKRVAGKIAADIQKVTGRLPEVRIDGHPRAAATVSGIQPQGQDAVFDSCPRQIFCATLGRSALLAALAEEGKLDTASLEGRREVFCIRLVEKPFPGVEEALVICGSDKRGTIYGMFTLSEYIGVSPLCYWGDAEPARREQVVIGKDIETVSKEPSVRYRGFFINDEWPCFGNWACSHFGDFNAACYEHVFELLLRMKGNYLWPAMWSAAFPLDGPGSRNEELADIYGVVMGYSHHEPCLRASEEWDKVRGPETRYGSQWNFYTNEQGLLNYWEDALKRSGKYENIITIGMRGERDTSMLGEQATVEENVKLLKDIIHKQRELIRRNVERGEETPQLLALYKEVEQYFYGDENIRGLKDWEELDGVICMLCEDNHGQMRTLPTEDIRSRRGGFGMYYHFDYHGGPVSYEWVDSTPLVKTWEQMCMAYEYGIREVWIVNVGDLKLHEVPLTYFMTLAYDYEKWGYGNPDSSREYTALWTRMTFPQAGEALQEKIGRVLTDYIKINSLRRPESLHSNIYHPCHYEETDRMLQKALELEQLSTEIMAALGPQEQDAYYSMIHFPAMASMNLLKLHLYAGKNAHYAGQGRAVANRYAALVRECIQRDRELSDAFGAFKDGKWNGMQLAQHIGFTKWNEDGYRYPVICQVEPVHIPRMSVSRRDDERTALKNYGTPMAIQVWDFLDAGCEQVALEIANDGVGSLQYEVTAEGGDLPEWLVVTPQSGTVTDLQEVTLRCLREKLPDGEQTLRLLIQEKDSCVAVDVRARAVSTEELPERTFLPRRGVVTIEAAHFCRKRDSRKGGFQVIEDYGKYASGVKVFPSTAVFTEDEEQPELTYRFLAEEAGVYQIDLLTAPTNSVVNRQRVGVLVENRTGSRAVAELVPADFRAGENSDDRWCRGVLDQARRTSVLLPFEKGVEELTVKALEAGAVLERIYIHKPENRLAQGYLGPEESFCSR